MLKRSRLWLSRLIRGLDSDGTAEDSRWGNLRSPQLSPGLAHLRVATRYLYSRSIGLTVKILIGDCREMLRTSDTPVSRCDVCEPQWCDECKIYVIAGRDGGLVKVGMSIRPVQRLGQLRKQTRRDLYLFETFPAGCSYAAGNLERLCHESLAASHVYGDWFEISASFASIAVAEVTKGLPK